MKKLTRPRLALHRQTLREISLAQVGGMTGQTCGCTYTVLVPCTTNPRCVAQTGGCTVASANC